MVNTYIMVYLIKQFIFNHRINKELEGFDLIYYEVIELPIYISYFRHPVTLLNISTIGGFKMHTVQMTSVKKRQGLVTTSMEVILFFYPMEENKSSHTRLQMLIQAT